MAEATTGGMEFRAGRVMARSFAIMFRNILPFGLIALVLTSPTSVYLMLAETGDLAWDDGYGVRGDISMAVIYVADTLLGSLIAAALVYGTIQDLRKNRVGAGECLSQGLARMFQVLVIAILSGAVPMVVLLPVMLGWLAPQELLVLVIPGLYVTVLLWVAIPVAVIEGRGFGSLARSVKLTAGYRWRILSVLLLTLLTFAGPIALLTAIGTAISVGGWGHVGYLTMEWILSAATSMFMAVTYAVSYHDLRIVKEGVDTNRIAAVFD